MNKDTIANYLDITRSISIIKSFNDGFITNFYFGEEYCNILTKNNLLFTVAFEKCIFILRKNRDFYHLYYICTNNNSLDESLKMLININNEHVFVIDIVGVEAYINDIITIYEKNGFIKYTRLYRMSRTKNISEIQKLDDRVNYALLNHAEQIKLLFDEYFDPYSEQIPLIDEIRNWIEKKSIFIIEENEKIAGFVIYEIIGMTSYLRYWFTHPDHRDKKIGSALLRRFFHECKAAKRQIFWVIECNDNAINRYKHYGFESEKLFDQIMIRR